MRLPASSRVAIAHRKSAAAGLTRAILYVILIIGVLMLLAMQGERITDEEEQPCSQPYELEGPFADPNCNWRIG